MPEPPDNEQVSQLPITLLMANLSAILSELLSKAFESVPDIQVVETCTTAPSIAGALRTGSIDVVLLGTANDHRARRALETVHAVRHRSHRTRCLVLSEKLDYSQTVALFRAGASGIISGSDLRFGFVCDSIRQVHRGSFWANGEPLQHLVAALKPTHSRAVPGAIRGPLLTSREQQVLQLLSEGLSNTQLAAELSLSEHTIKNHLFKIYEKLGVSNRMEAVLYFLTHRNSPAR